MTSQTPYLDQYTLNLTQKVRQNIDYFQAFNREAVTKRVVISLGKQIQNSPVLIGEPGVGKTAIIEDLTRQFIINQDPRTVIQINLANLMTTQNGESFAFKFQKIIDELIANKGHVIAFIDEIHQIVATGAQTSDSALDAGNILKPALGRDDLQIIGATTIDEFQKYIATDGALMRRLDTVAVPEPTEAETLAILKNIRPKMSPDIEISDAIMKQIVDDAKRYITTRFFPEKAIMLLDATLSLARYEGTKQISAKQVADIIHSDYGVPRHVIEQNHNVKLDDLFTQLSQEVIGQDEAIAKVTQKLMIRDAGLDDLSKPISFAFAGVTGVGKTQLAKALAKTLFGSEDQCIRFDMSEFKFAQTSIQRFRNELTKRVRHQPHGILLLDEFDKSDPEIWDLLLQVLDDGRLSDEYGRLINFKDLIILMTTNIGHKSIMQRQARSEAYQADAARTANFDHQFEQELKAAGLRDEFINRIGSVIIFNVLKTEDIIKITELKLAKLATAVKRQGYNLVYQIADVSAYLPTVTQGFEEINGMREPSWPIAQYLADIGYQPEHGVRPLDTVIDEYVSEPLALAIRSKQTTGDTFVFRAVGNKPDDYSLRGTWRVVYTLTAHQEQFVSRAGVSDVI